MKISRRIVNLVVARNEPRKSHVVYYRKDTKDSRVIKEVLESPCYERKKHPSLLILPGEKWLDLGAHIGCFSLLCVSKGAFTLAYEPEQSNYHVLQKNLRDTNCEHTRAVMTALTHRKVNLLKPTRKRDHSIPNTKYSVFPMSSYAQVEPVKNVRFSPRTTHNFDGIKMDIEGAEHAILDNLLQFPPANTVKKMVIEYHFIKDRSLANFKRRMDNLREVFSNIHYPEHLDRFLSEGMELYPGYFDRLIHCTRD